ncbi:MAG: hypothetical protein ACSHXW_19195 [Yoonia sp.]
MTTFMLLVAQYGPVNTLPFRVVAGDVFDVDTAQFLKHLKSGKIDPLGEDPARLSTYGIPLQWLAQTIDNRRELAKAEILTTY